MPDTKNYDDNYEIDYARVTALMSVVEQVSKVCPQNTSISSVAMAELKKLNDDILVWAGEKAKHEQAVKNEEIAKKNAQLSEENAKDHPDTKPEPEALARVIPPVVPGQPDPTITQTGHDTHVTDLNDGPEGSEEGLGTDPTKPGPSVRRRI